MSNTDDAAGGKNHDTGNGITGSENPDHSSRTIFVDPGTIAGPGNSNGGNDNPGSGGGNRRKRGRPKGSGAGSGNAAQAQAPINDTPSTKVPFSIDGVSAILLSIHTMAASFFTVPEMEIEKNEADKMADALKKVADHYDVKASEKSLAWTNLITTTAMVYGTRAFAYRARKSMEREQNKTKSTPLNVVRS